MLEEIIAQIIMGVAFILCRLWALVIAIGEILLYIAYYLLVGCVYGLAYCILPFYWSWNEVFKSRS